MRSVDALGRARQLERELIIVGSLVCRGLNAAFAPAAAWVDMQVTQVDPGDCAAWVAERQLRDCDQRRRRFARLGTRRAEAFSKRSVASAVYAAATACRC